MVIDVYSIDSGLASLQIYEDVQDVKFLMSDSVKELPFPYCDKVLITFNNEDKCPIELDLLHIVNIDVKLNTELVEDFFNREVRGFVINGK